MTAHGRDGSGSWDEGGYPTPWGTEEDEAGAPTRERLAWDDFGEAGSRVGRSATAEPEDLAELEWFTDEAFESAAPWRPDLEQESPATAETEDFGTEELEAEAFEGLGPQGSAAVGMEGESPGFPSGITLPLREGRWPRGSEHWDPHDTGLPLYEISPQLHRERLSANFTVKELASSGGQTAQLARISPALVRLLQSVRDEVGRPVHVTSGYRSWARNEAIYRKRGEKPTLSRHCSGQAADVRVTGLSGIQLGQVAIDAGGPGLAVGMGIGRDYIHLDVRGQWVLWTYLGAVAGAAAKAAINEYRAGATGGSVPSGGDGVPPTGRVLTRTPDRLAGRVRYQKATECLDRAQPGARACANQWTRLTGRRAGIVNCRPIRNDPANGWSVHSEGRAIDAYADADDPKQRAQAEAYVAWLQANAVELQCTYVIWNARQWSWGRRAQGWRPYPSKRTGRESKTVLHRDHIHIELSWEGSKHPSPLWERDVPNWPS